MTPQEQQVRDALVTFTTLSSRSPSGSLDEEEDQDKAMQALIVLVDFIIPGSQSPQWPPAEEVT